MSDPAIATLKAELIATRQLLDRAEATLAAIRWQPMTTAPKDGVSLLLRNFDGDIVIGTWMMATAASPCWWEKNGHAIYPTHWMSFTSLLDAAPKETT